VGVSQGTKDVLEFGEAHAHARDAVHAVIDVDALANAFQQAGFDIIRVRSKASSRREFLQRPDLGRRLDQSSAVLLAGIAQRADPRHPDEAGGLKRLSLVVGDGLSSRATMLHALPVLIAVRSLLPEWEMNHVILAEQARVALGDEVGALYAATATLMLLGERPGLQSADSLGAYITYQPRVGRSDSERNCISNIHGQGLPHDAAAQKIASLLNAAASLGASGIALRAKQNLTEPGLGSDRDATKTLADAAQSLGSPSA
jgi:ethanolamine ammonia-lyase small subunit